MKKCPFCAEDIQDAAIVCKHCGRDVPVAVPATPPPPAASNVVTPTSAMRVTPPASNRRKYGLIAVAVGFVMTMISAATAGLGFFVLWVGLAFAIAGGVIKRWGGGFLAAIFITTIGMTVGGVAESPRSTTAGSPSGVAPSQSATAAPRTSSVDQAKVAAEKDAACRKELRCWAEKHDIRASVYCAGVVERLAKNNFEWANGFLEPKFSHYRWRNADTGIVTYIGDRIKFQNGFGAWIFHTYECDYDPVKEAVVDVRARPGRLAS